jgi:hypothetical protein
MLATSLLFAPPSMTRMERVGSSSASRPAMMQPAVPPVDIISQGGYKGEISSRGPPAMIMSTSSMSSASLL